MMHVEVFWWMYEDKSKFKKLKTGLQMPWLYKRTKYFKPVLTQILQIALKFDQLDNRWHLME